MSAPEGDGGARTGSGSPRVERSDVELRAMLIQAGELLRDYATHKAGCPWHGGRWGGSLDCTCGWASRGGALICSDGFRFVREALVPAPAPEALRGDPGSHSDAKSGGAPDTDVTAEMNPLVPASPEARKWAVMLMSILFAKIMHGDEDHRRWLKDELMQYARNDLGRALDRISRGSTAGAAIICDPERLATAREIVGKWISRSRRDEVIGPSEQVELEEAIAAALDAAREMGARAAREEHRDATAEERA